MSHRPQQIGKEIMRNLSQILHHELPIEHYGLITITDVVVDTGLETAKIFFTVLNAKANPEDRLNQRAPHFAKELQKKIRIRKLPKLLFRYDDSADRYNRVEELINEEEKKRIS